MASHANVLLATIVTAVSVKVPSAFTVMPLVVSKVTVPVATVWIELAAAIPSYHSSLIRSVTLRNRTTRGTNPLGWWRQPLWQNQ